MSYVILNRVINIHQSFQSNNMENVEGLDLQSDAGILENYVKIRGNTLGKPVFYYFWVSVFAMVPGEKMQEIMKMEGFNVAKFVKKDLESGGGWEMLSRELGFYKDIKTNKIMSDWINPYTQETNNVLHV